MKLLDYAESRHLFLFVASFVLLSIGETIDSGSRYPNTYRSRRKVKHAVAVSTDGEQAREKREVGAGLRVVASVEGIEPTT